MHTNYIILYEFLKDAAASHTVKKFCEMYGEDEIIVRKCPEPTWIFEERVQKFMWGRDRNTQNKNKNRKLKISMCMERSGAVLNARLDSDTRALPTWRRLWICEMAQHIPIRKFWIKWFTARHMCKKAINKN